jgi:hypothetical protein
MKRTAASLLALALSPAALAANDPWSKDFTLQLGAFDAEAETKVRFDATGTTRAGTEVSLESDLGVQRTKTLPDFFFLWRLNARHAIEGQWVLLERSGSRSITGEINWGDATFPINAAVNTTFDANVFRVAYRYSPINEGGTELGFLLGLHYTKLETSMASQSGSVSDSASVDVPLPTIGIRGSVKIADNWRLTGFGQILKVKIDEYDGELYNYSAAVEWAVLPNAYVGLGYNYYDYRLTSEKDRARGKFEFKFDGPTLYGAWSF